MLRAVEIVLFVFFALPIIGLLLGYRPWDGQPTFEEWEATIEEDARRDELAAEYAKGLLAHERGNATSKLRSAAESSSAVEPESEQEPIPRPLSPWLDESR